MMPFGTGAGDAIAAQQTGLDQPMSCVLGAVCGGRRAAPDRVR